LTYHPGVLGTRLGRVKHVPKGSDTNEVDDADTSSGKRLTPALAGLIAAFLVVTYVAQVALSHPMSYITTAIALVLVLITAFRYLSRHPS
jgi:hypothetical protein